jgi:hypothetical protein
VKVPESEARIFGKRVEEVTDEEGVIVAACPEEEGRRS